MMDICEAECPGNTSPVEMEEVLKDRKYYNNKKNDEEKEAKWPDGTSTVDVEEGVSDREDDKN